MALFALHHVLHELLTFLLFLLLLRLESEVVVDLVAALPVHQVLAVAPILLTLFVLGHLALELLLLAEEVLLLAVLLLLRVVRIAGLLVVPVVRIAGLLVVPPALQLGGLLGLAVADAGLLVGQLLLVAELLGSHALLLAVIHLPERDLVTALLFQFAAPLPLGLVGVALLRTRLHGLQVEHEGLLVSVPR